MHTLEVDHQPVVAPEGRHQLPQLEVAVPTPRTSSHRSHRNGRPPSLQVPDLEAAAVPVHVALDHVDAQVVAAASPASELPARWAIASIMRGAQPTARRLAAGLLARSVPS